MRRGDVDDPLLRQVLPLADELIESPGYGADPLHEHAADARAEPAAEIRGRALLITTQACAIHCRYCFRREFPYSAQAEAEEGAGRAGARRSRRSPATPSIEEVILSGGDPLSLSDARLTRITDAIAAMPHVQRIRVHTRQPVVLPSRVDDGPARLAARHSAAHGVRAARQSSERNRRRGPRRLREAARAGVTLLNQSVLLAGVNDDVDTLARPVARAHGCRRYTLLPAPAGSGARHRAFRCRGGRAQQLVERSGTRLSGYLVPRLVREVPGAPYKVPSVSGA